MWLASLGQLLLHQHATVNAQLVNQRCSVLIPPQNGQTSCQINSKGKEVCTISCNSGYHLEGSEGEHSCELGNWYPAVKEPKCVDSNAKDVRHHVQFSDQTDMDISTCQFWGGDTFKTFDGAMYRFPGKCNYKLFGDCASSAFSVNLDLSRNEIATVFGGQQIILRAENNTVNLYSGSLQVERTKIPSVISGLIIEQMGDWAVLKSPDFVLRWDGADNLVVILSKTLETRSCGLCGNFDGLSDNDFTTIEHGDSTSPIVFGNSWKMPSVEGSCKDASFQKFCENQTPENIDFYRSECKKIASTSFSKCHDIINIEPWIEMCVESLCSGGDLCDSAAAYFRECSVQGIALDWRSENMCAKQCPAGQVYKECASGCPETCKAGAIECNDECVSGCVCAEGLVLHDGECIKKTHCPCFSRGVEYSTGESIKDVCNTCICEEGKWTCTDDSCDGICKSTGVNHFETFDGSVYDFVGECAYSLVEPIEPGDDNIWAVYLRYHDCEQHVKKLCKKSIEVRVGESYFTFEGGFKTSHDGHLIEHFPIQANGVQVTMASTFIQRIDITEVGISIFWNGKDRVYVHAQAALRDSIHGLCGTFNDRTDDDLKIPDGTVQTSAVEFGNTWKALSICQNEFDDSNDLHPCDTYLQLRSSATGSCEALMSPAFSSCHNVVAVESFYYRCTYDYCACAGVQMSMAGVCSAVEDYARSCAEAGVTIDWQQAVDEQCQPSCPGDMRYQQCGHNSATCESLSSTALLLPHDSCAEGCYCPDGLFLDRDHLSCVAADECTCAHAGKLYESGASRAEGCQDCICSNGAWTCVVDEARCVDKSCPAGMEWAECVSGCEGTCSNLHILDKHACEAVECSPGCQCKKDFVKLGDECVAPSDCPCFRGGKSYSEDEVIETSCEKCTCSTSGHFECEAKPCWKQCSVFGDPHFTTFDGKSYKFQGSCKYVFARSQSNATDLSINIENVPCGSSGVTCTRNLDVSWRGDTISIDRETYLDTLKLPKDCSSWTSGAVHFLQCADVFVLKWDDQTTVSLLMNPRLSGSVEGLCGNMNGNQNDDFKTPGNGLIETSASIFGDSWKIFGYCPEATEVQDTCAEHPNRQNWAKKSCAVIKSSAFSSCHNVVPTKMFYDACVYDGCGCDSGGDCECTCTAIAAYANECARNGIVVDWRKPDLCPMQCGDCPLEYSACNDPCPKTCQNRHDFATISENCQAGSCAEGCACQDGKIWDQHAGDCVFEENCTCGMFDGVVFMEGDLVPTAGNECENCFCSEGKLECIGSGCTTSSPITTTTHVSTTFTTTTDSTCCTKDEREYVPGDVIKSIGCEVYKCNDNCEIILDTSDCANVTTTKPTTTIVTKSPKCITETNEWTDWMNYNIPTLANDGDFENHHYLRRRFEYCGEEMISAVECRPAGASTYSGQMVTCDVNTGLTCFNNNQDIRMCLDYEVRFFCRCGVETTTEAPTIAPSTVPTAETTETIVIATTTSMPLKTTASMPTKTSMQTKTTTPMTKSTSPAATTISNTGSTTTETELKTTTVHVCNPLAPASCEMGWSEWLKLDEVPLNCKYQICEAPTSVECRVWNKQVNKIAPCSLDVQTCEGCEDMYARFYCPCDTTVPPKMTTAATLTTATIPTTTTMISSTSLPEICEIDMEKSLTKQVFSSSSSEFSDSRIGYSGWMAAKSSSEEFVSLTFQEPQIITGLKLERMMRNLYPTSIRLYVKGSESKAQADILIPSGEGIVFLDQPIIASEVSFLIREWVGDLPSLKMSVLKQCSSPTTTTTESTTTVCTQGCVLTCGDLCQKTFVEYSAMGLCKSEETCLRPSKCVENSVTCDASQKFDGSRCVNSQECACVTEDGTVMKPGTVLQGEDCTHICSDNLLTCEDETTTTLKPTTATSPEMTSTSPIETTTTSPISTTTSASSTTVSTDGTTLLTTTITDSTTTTTKTTTTSGMTSSTTETVDMTTGETTVTTTTHPESTLDTITVPLQETTITVPVEGTVSVTESGSSTVTTVTTKPTDSQKTTVVIVTDTPEGTTTTELAATTSASPTGKVTNVISTTDGTIIYSSTSSSSPSGSTETTIASTTRGEEHTETVTTQSPTETSKITRTIAPSGEITTTESITKATSPTSTETTTTVKTTIAPTSSSTKKRTTSSTNYSTGIGPTDGDCVDKIVNQMFNVGCDRCYCSEAGGIVCKNVSDCESTTGMTTTTTSQTEATKTKTTEFTSASSSTTRVFTTVTSKPGEMTTISKEIEESCLVWDNWQNNNLVSTGNDNEPISQYLKNSDICAEVMDIECRVAKFLTPSDETTDITTCDIQNGLTCVPSMEDFFSVSSCLDYEIRLYCVDARKPECQIDGFTITKATEMTTTITNADSTSTVITSTKTPTGSSTITVTSPETTETYEVTTETNTDGTTTKFLTTPGGHVEIKTTETEMKTTTEHYRTDGTVLTKTTEKNPTEGVTIVTEVTTLPTGETTKAEITTKTKKIDEATTVETKTTIINGDATAKTITSSTTTPASKVTKITSPATNVSELSTTVAYPTMTSSRTVTESGSTLASTTTVFDGTSTTSKTVSETTEEIVKTSISGSTTTTEKLTTDLTTGETLRTTTIAPSKSTKTVTVPSESTKIAETTVPLDGSTTISDGTTTSIITSSPSETTDEIKITVTTERVTGGSTEEITEKLTFTTSSADMTTTELLTTSSGAIVTEKVTTGSSVTQTTMTSVGPKKTTTSTESTTSSDHVTTVSTTYPSGEIETATTTTTVIDDLTTLVKTTIINGDSTFTTAHVTTSTVPTTIPSKITLTDKQSTVTMKMPTTGITSEMTSLVASTLAEHFTSKASSPSISESHESTTTSVTKSTSAYSPTKPDVHKETTATLVTGTYEETTVSGGKTTSTSTTSTSADNTTIVTTTTTDETKSTTETITTDGVTISTTETIDKITGETTVTSTVRPESTVETITVPVKETTITVPAEGTVSITSGDFTTTTTITTKSIDDQTTGIAITTETPEGTTETKLTETTTVLPTGEVTKELTTPDETVVSSSTSTSSPNSTTETTSVSTTRGEERTETVTTKIPNGTSKVTTTIAPTGDITTTEIVTKSMSPTHTESITTIINGDHTETSKTTTIAIPTRTSTMKTSSDGTVTTTVSETTIVPITKMDATTGPLMTSTTKIVETTKTTPAPITTTTTVPISTADVHKETTATLVTGTYEETTVSGGKTTSTSSTSTSADNTTIVTTTTTDETKSTTETITTDGVTVSVTETIDKTTGETTVISTVRPESTVKTITVPVKETTITVPAEGTVSITSGDFTTTTTITTKSIDPQTTGIAITTETPEGTTETKLTETTTVLPTGEVTKELTTPDGTLVSSSTSTSSPNSTTETTSVSTTRGEERTETVTTKIPKGTSKVITTIAPTGDITTTEIVTKSLSPTHTESITTIINGDHTETSKTTTIAIPTRTSTMKTSSDGTVTTTVSETTIVPITKMDATTGPLMTTTTKIVGTTTTTPAPTTTTTTVPVTTTTDDELRTLIASTIATHMTTKAAQSTKASTTTTTTSPGGYCITDNGDIIPEGEQTIEFTECVTQSCDKFGEFVEMTVPPKECSISATGSVSTFDEMVYDSSSCTGISIQTCDSDSLFINVLPSESLVFKLENLSIKLEDSFKSLSVDGVPFDMTALDSLNEVLFRKAGVRLLDLDEEFVILSPLIRITISPAIVKIRAEPIMFGKLCGGCGNADCNSTNDNVENPSSEDDNNDCGSHTCEQPMEDLEEICSYITEQRFSACVTNFTAQLDFCKKSACDCLSSGDSLESCRCKMIAAAMNTCQLQTDSCINWRSQYNCPMPECAGNKIWRDCGSTCVRTCAHILDEQESCDDEVYQPGCYCPPGTVYKGGQCVDERECKCTCKGWGDPHYQTFDKTYYAFQGNCSYVLAQDENKDFTVIGHNEYCLESPLNTCTKAVTLRYKGHEVTLVHGLSFIIDEVTNSVLEEDTILGGNIAVKLVRGRFILIEVEQVSLKIMYDEMTRGFAISIPILVYHDRVGGLCGNCNLDGSDDFIDVTGEQHFVPITFAETWKLEEVTCDDEVYTTRPPTMSTTHGPNNCTSECEILMDDVFSSCRKVVDVSPFLSSCVFDACNNLPNASCYAIGAYADECRKAGICVNWREEKTECPFTCDAHLEYNHCANTCDNNECDSKTSTNCEIVEECNCPEGLILQNAECIKPEDCLVCLGEYKEGEKWRNETDPCIEHICTAGTVEQKTETCHTEVRCLAEGMVAVEVPVAGECCSDYECQCDRSTCAEKPTCAEDEHLVVLPGMTCCDSYTCQPKSCSVSSTVDFLQVEECVSLEKQNITNCSGYCTSTTELNETFSGTAKMKSCTCCTAMESSKKEVDLVCPGGVRVRYEHEEITLCSCNASQCTEN